MKAGLFATAIYVLFSFIAPLGETFNISSFAPRGVAGFEYVAGACDDECGDEYGGGIMPAAASANGFQGYDNFSQAYFKGLTSNFGSNKKNSCGYIAASMLLTYYDTFLNDNIVPECYDVTSVGADTNMILRNNSPGSSDHGFDSLVNGNTTASDYYNLVCQYKDVSLHARLLYLCQERFGLYNLLDDDEDFRVSLGKVGDVIWHFLEEVSGLNPLEHFELYSKTLGTSNSKRQNIIAEVKRGNPVIVLLGKSGEDLGHFCVAYDYDEAVDALYVHSGWHSGGTRRTLLNMYDTYRGYLFFRFYINHSHSNNYAVEQADGTYKYYCYCDEEIITYKHDECKFTYRYTVSDGTHTAYCTCGNSIVQNHSYTHRYDRFNELQHIAYCACGKSVAQNHTWTIIDGLLTGSKLLSCTGCKLTKPDDFKTPVTRD